MIAPALAIGSPARADPPAPAARIHPLSAEARERIDRRLRATLTELDEEISQNPDHVASLSKRGDTLLFLGRFDEAARDFGKMIAIDPAQDAPHWRLGIALYFAGHHGKSAHQFAKYHAYDGRDRENGVWKFMAQAAGEGVEKARAEMLEYREFDREPFPSVYEMLAGRMSAQAVLDDMRTRGLDARPTVKFFASYYAGVNEWIAGRRERGLDLVGQAVAAIPGGDDATGGPGYMWHVARVHYDWMAAQMKPTSPGAVGRHGALRIDGTRLLDSAGRPMVLRGMSFFWSQWMPRFYNREAVMWLSHDWGCTVVRAAMAVEHDGFLRHPDREKARVEAVVRAAIDAGIYVIIDWHDHRAHEHLAEARGFFAEMARTFGGHPNVLYEPWNEPLKDHDWSMVIKPYHEAIIAAIRAHDPDNIVICGTQTWSQDVDKAARDPIAAVNVAYAVHFYAGTHNQPLRDKIDAALAAGAAVIVSEWGTSEASGSGKLDIEETRRWWEFMDRRQLSWCNWSIADKVETSAALNRGAAAGGGWPADSLTPSGTLVRDHLRAKAAAAPPAVTR